jgi:hypothetical protein
MPSDRYLDEITKYFDNLSPEQFDEDLAEANPPVPAEAIGRPPLREPRAPTRRKMPPALPSETHEVRFRRLEKQMDQVLNALKEMSTSPGTPATRREKQANNIAVTESISGAPDTKSKGIDALLNNLSARVKSSTKTNKFVM